MSYKKTIRGWIICFIICIGLYEYFEAPDLAAEEEVVVEDISQNEEDTVESPGNLEVHFLDVGQADCTLIKCDGYTMLIDAGEDDQGTKIQNYLKKQGVEKLNYLILTHPDSDHIGSADVILTKFETDTVFMSNYEKETRIYTDLLKLMKDSQIEYRTPEVGDVYPLGSASFQILAPNDEYEDPNNASIALLLTHGENSFLFTGDAEKSAEKDMLDNGLNLAADVFHAGHHGSKTSNTEDFMDAVNPQYAVISCGVDNSYGLPDAEVLNRFRQNGIKVYRTDEQGTIVASSDGKQIIFNASPSETWQAGEKK